jgi:hypothetical protein
MRHGPLYVSHPESHALCFVLVALDGAGKALTREKCSEMRIFARVVFALIGEIIAIPLVLIFIWIALALADVTISLEVMLIAAIAAVLSFLLYRHLRSRRRKT